MYTINELLFPHHAINALKDCRGQAWKSLVERILPLDQCHEEKLAFMLMMIRLNGCMSCETDSYRAMRGCVSCAQQMLRRYKGEDDALLAEYEVALQDIRKFQQEHPTANILQTLPAM